MLLWFGVIGFRGFASVEFFCHAVEVCGLGHFEGFGDEIVDPHGADAEEEGDGKIDIHVVAEAEFVCELEDSPEYESGRNCGDGGVEGGFEEGGENDAFELFFDGKKEE